MSHDIITGEHASQPHVGHEPVGCRRCVGQLAAGPLGDHRKSCGCPCVATGCAHAAGDEMQAYVTEQQRRLRERHRIIVTSRTRAQLRAVARWWELEAQRGYPTAGRSREYAANQRWLVELLDAGVDINRPFHELVRERRRATEP